MAEHYERFKQFDYQLNSNLVIQRENHANLQSNEPTGEPETLAGRLKHSMGDKAVRGLAADVLERIEKKRAETLGKTAPAAKRLKTAFRAGESVLGADISETYTYTPITRETRAIFEQLLGETASVLSDQPDAVVRDAAIEIVLTCRNNELSTVKKRELLEELLGHLPTQKFAKLEQLAKGLYDYRPPADFDLDQDGRRDEDAGTGDGQALGDDIDGHGGVAVVFDDEEDGDADLEDNEGLLVDDITGLTAEVRDDELDEAGPDAQNTDESAGPGPLQVAGADLLMDEGPDEEEEETRRAAADSDPFDLSVAKIDAHWLQRELGRVFEDLQEAVRAEKAVLSALALPDLQACENQLVQILQFESFQLVKLLVRNRWRVYFCTKLRQAQTREEEEAIIAQMRSESAGQAVLAQMEFGKLRRNRERELAISVRREAAALAAAAKNTETDDVDDETIVGPTAESAIANREPERYYDIEGMAFRESSRIMSNDVVKLHENSKRIEKKAYDEVIIPPPARPSIDEQSLKPISGLPEWAQAAFPGVTTLNPIQSQVYDVAFGQPEKNMLVCAPTGAGKTNVAMLAMLSILDQFRDPVTNEIDKEACKIVYISPMKALVSEQVAAFQKRLDPYGLQARELTGDMNLTRKQIQDTQLIVATPEKWDVVTRRGGGERALAQQVRLIIIDEIHLLHDSRGPVLEAIVSRTLRQIETTQEPTRLVGLSATLPNYQDVAIFLRVSLEPNQGLFVFDGRYRPVPLLQTFVGLKEKKAVKRLATMNQVLYDKVLENAGVNQVLVFVHSRRETVRTARFLKQRALEEDALAKFLGEDSASREILLAEGENTKTVALKDLLPFGFAVHHAGLTRHDRKLVEDLFADRHIQVLISTATLAWGVNLPAHTVIIKGTNVYVPERGGWVELSPLDVMQMMGRAGRPQYDKTGEGVIITQHSELQFYLSLNNQQLPIESQMFAMLPDILNAEIAASGIRSRSDVVNWLGYTYLYVRLLRNPVTYGFPADSADGDPALEQVRTDIAHSALLVLDRHQLCRYDKRSGTVQPTALGRIASNYYLRYASVAVYNEHLRPAASDIDLLRVFSLSSEFKGIPVREEEKTELAKLLERVPVPVKGGGVSAMTVDGVATKVNVLLQAFIARLRLEGFALATDTVYVQQSATRIMRALFEISLRRGWAGTAERALELCKMTQHRMWGTMSPLRQFPDALPDDVIRRLEKKDFPWSKYHDLTSAELGELIRQPKLGKLLHRLVHTVPKVDLAAYMQPFTRSTLLIDITITPDFRWDAKFHDPAGEMFWLLIEDGDAEIILHHDVILLHQDQVSSPDPFEMTVSCAVPITAPLPQNYFIKCISDKFLRAETVLPLSFHNLILPEKNRPHSELLDLQPLPIAALRHPKLEHVYGKVLPSGTFEPIETQAFSLLRGSDENALISAPATPNGLCTLGEFAVLRTLTTDAQNRCVWLLPTRGLAQQRYETCNERLAGPLGVNVGLLTGQVSADLKLLAENQIIISAPSHWDLCSRRWKTRKVFQQIRLFIAEGLEHLGADDGPTFEISVARMRYISAQMPQPIRIVGLSISLANAASIGEWIGADLATSCFTFSTEVRSKPLEIIIQGFDSIHRTGRLAAMARPAYYAINRHAANSSIIIFCSDRKQVRLTAVDLLLFATADNTPTKFLKNSEKVSEELIKSLGIKEKALQQAMLGGVGYIHEGMAKETRDSVIQLYESGVLRILLLTEKVKWDIHSTANLIIVMETTKYDAKNKRYNDYSLLELSRMLSRAAPSENHGTSTFLVFCPATRKAFYRKFLTEPFPVESRLDQNLADHLNAEITLHTVESKQDAVDWITWTYYYRRLAKNPNYYGLQTLSSVAISEHLSETIEAAVSALEVAQCVATDPEDGMTLTELNLGMVAAYYHIKYVSVDLMNKSITENTKWRALIEILSAAPDLAEVLEMRQGEENILRTISMEAGLRLSNQTDISDPHVKCLILLHAHLARIPLTTDMRLDLTQILESALSLCHALVDVISSNSWLNPAIAAMELSQQLVQAIIPGKSPLLQLPDFTEDRVAAANKLGIADIFDLINSEEENRNAVLADLPLKNIEIIAQACNRYPVLEIEFEIDGQKYDSETPFELVAGSTATLAVNVERVADEQDLGEVIATRFPATVKYEQWWLVVGDSRTNSLLAVKRSGGPGTALQSQIKLSFDAPPELGTYEFVLNLICDSYVGCDQELKFKVRTVAAKNA